MSKTRLMVCDDDSLFRQTLTLGLSPGFDLTFTASPAELLEGLAAAPHDALLLDLNLNAARDGFWALHQVRQLFPQICVLVHSGRSDCAAVVKAMRLGAVDYLAKGCDMQRLKRGLMQALSKAPGGTNAPGQAASAQSSIVGQNARLQRVLSTADKFRAFPGNVLILGESGVGKESLARRVHSGTGQFVAVDAANIHESTADSMLFGHERGAYSGAETRRMGLFEEADGGTLFIDEIANLCLSVQAKLLRVLQTMEIRPLGANALRRIKLRVVTATNQDLVALGHAGAFRPDLYARLAVLSLCLPPLRERLDDMGALLDFFLHQFKGPSAEALPREVIACFQEYAWPGNVRELANTVQYMVAMAGGGTPTLADLPQVMVAARETVPPAPAAGIEGMTFRKQMHRYEQQLLHHEYEQTCGRVALMSQRLGLDRSYLYAKLKALGILSPRRGAKPHPRAGQP